MQGICSRRDYPRVARGLESGAVGNVDWLGFDGQPHHFLDLSVVHLVRFLAIRGIDALASSLSENSSFRDGIKSTRRLDAQNN